jgi:hypothetical protein
MGWFMITAQLYFQEVSIQRKYQCKGQKDENKWRKGHNQRTSFLVNTNIKKKQSLLPFLPLTHGSREFATNQTLWMWLNVVWKWNGARGRLGSCLSNSWSAKVLLPQLLEGENFQLLAFKDGFHCTEPPSPRPRTCPHGLFQGMIYPGTKRLSHLS